METGREQKKGKKSFKNGKPARRKIPVAIKSGGGQNNGKEKRMATGRASEDSFRGKRVRKAV